MILTQKWSKYASIFGFIVAAGALVWFGSWLGNRGNDEQSTSRYIEAERAEYLRQSAELAEGLQQSLDLVQQCLTDVGELRQLHTELRDTINEIGRGTESVGDDSISIGISVDENLRIIAELERRESIIKKD